MTSTPPPSTPPERPTETNPVSLAGNGVALVRERALAVAVQRGLERLYQLEGLADVGGFVVEAGEDGREQLLVRHAEDGAIELSLRLPQLAHARDRAADLDPLCQIIEGVSHFLYVSHRAHHDRETTQLELELQAEVDKYIVLAASMNDRFTLRASRELRGRLYDDVHFAAAASSDDGQRYRLANTLARKYVRRLEMQFVGEGRFRELHQELRRFYRMGQSDKLRAAA